MPEISKRAQNLSFSPIRKLIPYADKAKRKGIKVYHLNIGQPDIKSPKIFLEKLKSYKETTVAYGQSDGDENFKKSLCYYYQSIGINIKPDEIITTYGGSEALTMAFFILLKKGQQCLTIEPFYTNYLTIAATAGIDIKTIATKIEDNFTLPPIEKIKKAVNPKTKAILICSPSNPTGALYSPKVFRRIG